MRNYVTPVPPPTNLSTRKWNHEAPTLNLAQGPKISLDGPTFKQYNYIGCHGSKHAGMLLELIKARETRVEG